MMLLLTAFHKAPLLAQIATHRLGSPVSLQSSGQNTSVGFVQRYVLTNAAGIIQYTADGFMSCMICRPNRVKFTTGGQWNASDAEKAGAYNSMMSYAGRYSIENNTVTHFVNLSLFPNWIGGQQKRSFQFDEQGQLSLTARLEENTSEARTALLLWKRG